MKKALWFAVAILVLASVGFAQENMGARPIAMGGAFTGLADDANAIFFNPAGIGYLQGEHATVSTKILEGREFTIIGGVQRTSIGSFGIGYIGSSFPLEDSTEAANLEEEGNEPARAFNQTLILSYARELNDFMVVPKSMGRFSIGTNLKFTSSKMNNKQGISSDLGSGMDLDLAAVFKPNDNLSCGIILQNFLDKDFPQATDPTESESNVAVGISGNLFNKSIIWSAEGKSLGCELRPAPGLAVRVGTDGGYNTAGFGININGFSVDYGYMERETPIHYVGISIAVERERAEPEIKQASLDLQ